MNNTKNYANQWDISAQFFYEKGYYSWMAQRINKFQTVVEVGCGTGYSTLALVENGYKVIAIDKNFIFNETWVFSRRCTDKCIY